MTTRSEAYNRYISSDDWKLIRTKIRQRARGYCERCKVGIRRDVHHLNYSRLGNEHLDDLVAVCRECHEFLHGIRKSDPASTIYSKDEIKKIRHIHKLYKIDFSFACNWLNNHPDYAKAWEKYKEVLQQ